MIHDKLSFIPHHPFDAPFQHRGKLEVLRRSRPTQNLVTQPNSKLHTTYLFKLPWQPQAKATVFQRLEQMSVLIRNLKEGSPRIPGS